VFPLCKQTTCLTVKATPVALPVVEQCLAEGISCSIETRGGRNLEMFAVTLRGVCKNFEKGFHCIKVTVILE